ncbi:FAD-dependent monooxygenase [Lentzea sp. NPDC092896]|uniref:FAD-dependent monooxygenase n=1 Tax=Lentzea sp. NPDC092896 TaxID=3364127 RepID=UPI00382F208B
MERCLNTAEVVVRSLRVVVIGGGPAGLFLGRLLKLADPTCVVEVHERNGPQDAFGFGVVFSDRTMSAFRAADPETHRRIRSESVSWTDMEMRLPGRVLRYGGYGFTAISRRVLLQVLQEQAADAGVGLVFHSGIDLTRAGEGQPDVIAVADGVNSAARTELAGRLGSRVETGSAKYIWFGTEARYDAVVFPFAQTSYGVFGAHAYPFADGLSTFIVETSESTWLAAGMDASTAGAQAPGQTDEYTRRLLGEVFRDHLDGRPLIGNNSKWADFQVVRNERWSDGRVVLLGDAAHTAHFSVGSGTKMAMEDAIALSAALTRAGSTTEAFASYEAARRPPITRTQALAEPSMRWWETFGNRTRLAPAQFGLHFLTRTEAIGYPGLRRRHAAEIDEAETHVAAQAWAVVPGSPIVTMGPAAAGGVENGLHLPMQLGSVPLGNRIVLPLAGTAAEQVRQAGAGAAAGGALLLADWRAGYEADGWSDAAERARECDVVFGVVLDTATAHLAAPALAAGALVLEFVASGDDETDDRVLGGLLDLTGPDAAVLAGFAVPVGSPWSARAERVLDRCEKLIAGGVCAVHARRDAARTWSHALAWADRLRTERGVPVLADGEDGWAAGVRAEDSQDDWATRLHVAVVSGRVDMVAAWPLGRPRVRVAAG